MKKKDITETESDLVHSDSLRLPETEKWRYRGRESYHGLGKIGSDVFTTYFLNQ